MTDEARKTTRNAYMSGPPDAYEMPRYDFGGKVAWITGASQGVGRHAAIALARCGATVACVARSDFGQEAAVKASIDRTVEEHGALHFGINNAGHSGYNAFIEDQTEERFDNVLDVNVKGAFFCMKHQVKAMRRNAPKPARAEDARADPEVGEVTERAGYGRIVNVGSAAAFIGVPNVGLYVASKHALWA